VRAGLLLLFAFALIAAAPAPEEAYQAALREAQKSPSADPRIPGRLESDLRAAATAGHAEAQLFYGLMLAELRPLAARDVAVAAWLPRGNGMQPDRTLPGLDIAEARRWLEAASAHPATAIRARQGLAYIAALLDPATAPAALDGLLGTGGMALEEAGALLETAGDCRNALARYARRLAERPGDPVLAARRDACTARLSGAPPDAVVLACRRQDSSAWAAGVTEPFDLSSYNGNRRAAVALYGFARRAACLREHMALATEGPVDLRVARLRAALDVIGQPFATGAGQSMAGVLADLLLTPAHPEPDAVAEAMRLLPRSGRPGRARAAALLRDGRLMPPDPVAERAMLAGDGPVGSGSEDAAAWREITFRRAVMLRDGIGGPRDALGALRLFASLRDDPPAREAIRAFYAGLPWVLRESDGRAWSPP